MAPSMACHCHSMPWSASYSSKAARQSFSKTPASAHLWK
jgi:hypothetical protein